MTTTDGIRILVVDDEHGIREGCRRILMSEGYSVDTAENGKAGLDSALAMKTIPYYNEVFKGELAKTAYMHISTKSAAVIDATWAAISRVIYEGGTADDSTATLVEDLKAIYE